MNSIKCAFVMLIAFCSLLQQADAMHLLKKYGKYITPATFGILIEKNDWFRLKVNYNTSKLILIHVAHNSLSSMHDERFFFNINIFKTEETNAYEVAAKKNLTILKQQDACCTEFLEKLMDDKDDTPFRELCAQCRKLELLHSTYPDLCELLLKHETTPKPHEFVKELHALSQQDKLPPQFNEAFTKHKKRIDGMGTWSITKYRYLYTIKQKFAS